MGNPIKVIPIGSVFGDWTVVALSNLRRGGKAVWECRCICGGIGFLDSSSLGSKRRNSCKSCNYIKRRMGPQKLIWDILINGAKFRSIPFNISRDETFALLPSQDYRCALSGVEIKMAATAYDHKRGGSTISLDRIDSSLPYDLDNVQWVHKEVNRMKQNFGEAKFLEWCRLITHHHEGGEK